jgi:hypothetical protein
MRSPLRQDPPLVIWSECCDQRSYPFPLRMKEKTAGRKIRLCTKISDFGGPYTLILQFKLSPAYSEKQN